jgi:NAD-dependent dihydropyrimidine dehydrogenase PreA subunit
MAGTDLPRERIPWFPTIANDLCTGDAECYNFCKNDVIEWDEVSSRPIVQNPYRCVVGCQACVNICDAGAISFPSKDELRQILRQLREELRANPAGLVAIK